MEEPSTRARLYNRPSTGHPKRPAATLFRHRIPPVYNPVRYATWRNRCRCRTDPPVLSRFHWHVNALAVLRRYHLRPTPSLTRSLGGHMATHGASFWQLDTTR